MKPKGKQGLSSRTAPEWVTLGVSIALLVAAAGAVLVGQLTRGSRPPSVRVEARLDGVRQRDGHYYVPLEIRNVGDLTAADVSVRISLVRDGRETEWTNLGLAYLPGGAEQKATAIFDRAPTDGSLSFDVSFSEP